MNHLSLKFMKTWASLGPRFLPFADIATPDLSFGRLLRLSLFQVSVGMAMVLLVGTLNRVMIVELGVPASLVGLMVALPVVAAPFRALIGFRSDNHQCALGWRRVPFIWRGTLAQFSGFALMPFALLVLAGKGESGSLPLFVGQGSAAIAFLLVGVGVHTVQTAGLALATDLTPEESHPRVVGMMYVMLLAGMMISALAYGAALVDFTPGRLVQVIQSAAVITMLLNGIALWKQETRRPRRGAPEPSAEPSFREAWTAFCAGDNTLRRLFILGLGTLAFAMADILLEPFGGQVLNMTVSSTTRLTALFAVGGLLGFGVASHMAGRGAGAYPVVFAGALIGLPAFALVMIAAPWQSPLLFMLGNFLIGFGGALFWHGTLTAMMNTAPRHQIGLAIGAWGAVQATAAGVAMASSGIIRDVVDALSLATLFGSERAAGYMTVYALEIALLLITLVAALPLLRASSRPSATIAAPAGAASEATT